MSLLVVTRSVARAEIQAAFRWYEREREGLGEEFLQAVDRVVGMPRTKEDRMLKKYWSGKGMLFREVPIGGAAGSRTWKEGSTTRRIDAVLLTGSATVRVKIIDVPEPPDNRRWSRPSARLGFGVRE